MGPRYSRDCAGHIDQYVDDVGAAAGHEGLMKFVADRIDRRHGETYGEMARLDAPLILLTQRPHEQNSKDEVGAEVAQFAQEKMRPA